MRLVRDVGELPQAIVGARREAVSAFGDGTLMLERLIDGLGARKLSDAAYRDILSTPQTHGSGKALAAK